MNKLFTVCVLFFIPCALSAQVFGGNPPSLKWKQINTDSARVIFPAGMDSQAKRVASIVHYLQQEKPVSPGNQLRKVNIVLQNQTTIPNAYVGLGPFRSEFYTTPDANNFSEGSLAWIDNLALHEYRHVMQYNNFRNGLSKLMSVIAGDDGLTVATNAAIPDWFFEGDAVYNETVLSNQGRGRLPLFTNAYPSLWQAGKKYSWMKLRNGSWKDYVPNHYYLGYLLVNYGREKYGSDFWTKVTTDASAFKGLFYPFQAAVKKYAGVDYKTFINDAFDSYKSSIEKAGLSDKDFLFPIKKDYVVSYYFPYSAGNDSLIYLKTSMRHRPAFYLKDPKGEHRIKTRDISIDEQFSYRNGKIVYAAYENDARRNWLDYGVIKVLDIKTGEQKTITHKTKYFTPDISADGTRIAAVQNSSDGKSELHILDAETGEVIKTIKSSEIAVFTDPKFIDDNNLVTAVRLKDGKMALAIAEISTGNTIRLTSPSYNVVGYPCVKGDTVYFTASIGGNDDVFALQLSDKDKKIYQITSGYMGKYFVNAGNGKLTWSQFTAEGYQLKQVDEKDYEWFVEVNPERMEKAEGRYSVSQAKESGDILLTKVPQRNFPVSDYKKSHGLLNIHSWRPYYDDPIFNFTLYSQNILNTLETELYYEYNRNGRTNAVGFSTIYGGWFPYLNLGTQYTFDEEGIRVNSVRKWSQLDSRIGLNIPLSKTSGQTYKSFNIGTNLGYQAEFNKGAYKDTLGTTSFSYLHHYVSWSQYVQQQVQHIYPRLGYAVSFAHRYAVSTYSGNQFIISGTVYVPGFLSNHNIVLSGSFQQRDTLGQVGFSNRFAYSRGYTGRYFSRMWRLSANYHLPLWHPDWGFGNILYIQRIRANAFYDFTKVYSRDKTQTRNQRSVGGEIYFDTKWWNQYPLTFGFRASKLLDQDQFDGFRGMVYEFIMPVNIIPR
ncbi:MAG: hypothetical protein HZB42_13560 [Sphingobacteriales bacterium]|nr:hypothetical protein [Sphingobacteriales bacterium]